ncbi:MAG: ADP-heptose:LPS heptosyltransferase [Verrucomicrobia bacterium]|jgi:ADP-heptose:LPS heptosyltransferase|nr:ADP-heptose:LPS heptosyltransferase [Verrucomicrobiota bacterium]
MGQKILVIRMDHLGDVVLTTPLVRALAMAGNEVQVIVQNPFVSVFANSPRVSVAHSMDDICPAFPQDWRKLADWMRAQRFDIVLLPYARQKELLWASFFSGTKTRLAMWSGVWGRLTLHRCLNSRMLVEPRYFGDVVLDCARALEIPPQGTEPELFLTDTESAQACDVLTQRFGSRPVIGIHPGCAGNACNLPPQVYGQIAQSLLERTDCALVITGSAKERDLVKTWPEQITASPRVWNSMGEISLRQLAATIRHFAVYVCPSTGPLHLASAQTVPTVSPFCASPTLSPVVWGNQRANATALTPAPEFCRNQRQGGRSHCDFCGQLSVESLVQATLRFVPGSV